MILFDPVPDAALLAYSLFSDAHKSSYAQIELRLWWSVARALRSDFGQFTVRFEDYDL